MYRRGRNLPQHANALLGLLNQQARGLQRYADLMEPTTCCQSAVDVKWVARIMENICQESVTHVGTLHMAIILYESDTRQTQTAGFESGSSDPFYFNLMEGKITKLKS